MVNLGGISSIVRKAAMVAITDLQLEGSNCHQGWRRSTNGRRIRGYLKTSRGAMALRHAPVTCGTGQSVVDLKYKFRQVPRIRAILKWATQGEGLPLRCRALSTLAKTNSQVDMVDWHEVDRPAEMTKAAAAVHACSVGTGLLCFHCDHHVVELPPNHRFPMQKYRATRLALESDKSLKAILTIHRAPAASVDELHRVHSQEYVEKVCRGKLNLSEQTKLGLPWSESLVQRSLASVGGTVAATHAVLGLGENSLRAAGILAGGTHHSFRTHGEGFCVFNDIAVAAAVTLDEYADRCNSERPVLILDLDVHQGNGTAAIFEDEHRVVTFSMHGEKNYPWRSKMRSTYDVELEDDCDDASYLSHLSTWIPLLFSRHQPGIVFYQAGVDALKEDSFGRLALTRAGLLRRNNLVYSACIAAGVPLVITMGGGYAKPIDYSITSHADVYRSAAYRFAASHPVLRKTGRK